MQRANELVVEIDTTRGRAVTVSPLACSFVLAAIDLLLVGGLAAAWSIKTDFSTARDFLSSGEALIFMLAPFIVALSLWQQGVYIIDQTPPPIFRAGIGCLNGCGLL